ncbi:MAG: rod-binding protein [Pseudomonadota bacterium]
MMTSILPEDSEYFGEGFAGDAWRSMLSDQLANVAVKQTDFGIASLIDQEASNQNATASVIERGKLGR